MSLLDDLVKQSSNLTPEERLRLIAHLAEQARLFYQKPAGTRQWQELKGAAPYPLTSGDAQAWVSQHGVKATTLVNNSGKPTREHRRSLGGGESSFSRYRARYLFRRTKSSPPSKLSLLASTMATWSPSHHLSP